ncbi:hypothetical protein D3C86_1632930 [compost metagenome]
MLLILVSVAGDVVDHPFTIDLFDDPRTVAAEIVTEDSHPHPLGNSFVSTDEIDEILARFILVREHQLEPLFHRIGPVAVLVSLFREQTLPLFVSVDVGDDIADVVLAEFGQCILQVGLAIDCVLPTTFEWLHCSANLAHAGFDLCEFSNQFFLCESFYCLGHVRSPFIS